MTAVIRRWLNDSFSSSDADWTSPIGESSPGKMWFMRELPKLASSVRGGLLRDVRIVVKSTEEVFPDRLSPFGGAAAGMADKDGKSYVVLQLNGLMSPAALDAMARPDESGDSPMQERMAMLFRHELTHLAEHSLEYRTYVRGDKTGPGTTRYFNEPVEVRAYMQEIVHDARTWVTRQHARLGDKALKPRDLVTPALESSRTWDQINYYLQAAARRRITLAVFRAVEEERARLLAVRRENPAAPEQPKVMNIEQYAKMTGGKTSADVQAHIHAGLRSAPKTKTYRRFFERRLAELQQAADETWRGYHAALERGEIVAPPSVPLEETAQRDDERGAAARRVLAARAARRAAKERA